ncbi:MULTISPECIES: hypothetical protein [Chelativorans]|uniref:Uncharacterized protein n=1 Tax=Chelativorans sp. (strain BNC1) TaxID=266779 RepID=Q11MZ2_CHESB|nr:MULTISPECIES: hypothetical protein [Chelativorans]
MTAGTSLADIGAVLVRWAKLVPALLWRDPIFRYAAIAAAVAMIFLIARLAQDLAGPGAIPPAGQATQGSGGPAGDPGHVDEGDDARGTGMEQDEEQPPRPGSASTLPAREETTPRVIAPGRSLENIEVEPAPADSFGTMPTGDPKR